MERREFVARCGAQCDEGVAAFAEHEFGQHRVMPLLFGATKKLVHCLALLGIDCFHGSCYDVQVERRNLAPSHWRTRKIVGGLVRRLVAVLTGNSEIGGVTALRNRPEQRAGKQAGLASSRAIGNGWRLNRVFPDLPTIWTAAFSLRNVNDRSHFSCP